MEGDRFSNLAYLHLRNATLYPYKTAFVYGTDRCTFSQFNERVNRLINALEARGINKGDRLAIIARNCPEYFETYGAAEKGGRVIVPLNFRFTGHELAHFLNHSGAVAIFVEEEFAGQVLAIRSSLSTIKYFFSLRGRVPEMEDYQAMLAASAPEEPQVEIGSDDPVYLMYTSGTTGRPRGAILTHQGQLENAKSFLMELPLTPYDKTLNVMPLFHAGGRAISLAHFYRGCTGIILKRFDPREVLEAIEHEGVTTLELIPPMVSALLEFPDLGRYRTDSLRMILYAAMPMPVKLLRAAVERFGPIFVQAYGLTESGPFTTILKVEDHIYSEDDPRQRRLRSCGLPAMNVEVKVVKEDGDPVKPGEAGEIITSSQFIMKGYWGEPELTQETIKEGWLYTGDLATVDDEGYIYIVGRKKEVIISGGENIYPEEIEQVIQAHPAVKEVAVVGVPDQKWGEAVKVFIALKPGLSVSPGDIVRHCQRHLASYKKPRFVEFIESLPRSETGKILRSALKQRL